jgi:acetolactate synthase I/II/III large subunit
MKASDVLVSCLENEGVEYIFGIIGKEVIDLADSLSKSKQIQFVPVRHEQGAAFMAGVYGKLTGKPGVCLATLGPGATNLLTGIATAHLDHSPVIALTGQKVLNMQHKSAHQYIGISRVFEPASKWSHQILSANTIPEVIRKAFRIALTEKPGAVVLEIPENVASENVTTKPLPVTVLPESVPSIGALKSAKVLIEQSIHPFIIIGNGVIRGGAVKEAQALIDQLGCPVTTSFMGKGILSKDHPENYYTFGFTNKDYVTRGIDEADLLIVIGLDFEEKLPTEWNRKKVPIIHIDATPAEVDEYYPVKAELVGSIRLTLALLISNGIISTGWKPSGKLKNRIEMSYLIEENSNKDTFLTIENILHVIEKVSNEQTIIVSDVGSHKISIARMFQPRNANQLIMSNGFASMGISIPGAIGAKFACPDQTVICITGDGGALMTFSELETAKRLGLSFVIIVLNDSMLKLEVEMMNQKFGESFGTTFANPDFLLLANSFGIKGVRPNSTIEFEEMLRNAIGSKNELILFDIKTVI